jgi:hypothetical protein
VIVLGTEEAHIFACQSVWWVVRLYETLQVTLNVLSTRHFMF